MSNINNVVLAGRLGSDSELKYTPNGVAVVDFRIAVNDYQGKEKGEYTNWINCICFGKEKVVNFLKKGVKVTVCGKLRQDRWEDTEGVKRSMIKIIVNDIELPGKSDNDSSGDKSYYPTDDDIPF